MIKRILAVTVLLLFAGLSFAEGPKQIKLPPPDMKGGKPLMAALKERKSSRSFSPKPLPAAVLSNLLWAANGVNRPVNGRRTAPSALNWQEVDIYVATADGLYLYSAKEHALIPVLGRDVRALTGKQSFVAGAPVNLVYVADYAKMFRASDEERQLYAAADTGFIAQNVYLFCASEGLAAVVRGMVDKKALTEVMKLRKDQRIILTQTVGYPEQ